jgi:hypothetical protein
MIWSTIGYNLSLLKSQIPVFAQKFVTPMAQILYTNSEQETIELTSEQTEDKEKSRKKTSEPTYEHFITVVDKVVFFVYLISICLIHI